MSRSRKCPRKNCTCICQTYRTYRVKEDDRLAIITAKIRLKVSLIIRILIIAKRRVRASEARSLSMDHSRFGTISIYLYIYVCVCVCPLFSS